MKIVLACEGQCEVSLINQLIENGYLKFENEILLDEPRYIRQLTDVKSTINSLPINEEIIIYRIGDTLSDSLFLEGFEMRIHHMKTYKICTKREIEILVIINEGYYKNYTKVKSKVKPKTFIRTKIKNFDFIEYIKNHDMMNSITEYSKLKSKTHNKDEYTLLDLINKLPK